MPAIRHVMTYREFVSWLRDMGRINMLLEVDIKVNIGYLRTDDAWVRVRTIYGDASVRLLERGKLLWK